MKISKRVCALLFVISIIFVACEKTDNNPASTSDRDKFIGNWQGNSSGTGGSRTFNMVVTASNSASDQIIFKNFDLTGTNAAIAATVSGSTFTFTSTLIGQDRYDGGGSISNGVMYFNFSIDDGQSIENRSGNAHK